MNIVQSVRLAAKRLVWVTLAVSILAAHPALAQLGFTEFTLSDSTLNSSPATDFWISSAAPADVDADGDLDLLVAGYYVVYPDTSSSGSAEDRLTLYRNDGQPSSTWALTPIPVDATGLYFTSADLAWGDYDNDGDPDVVVAGTGQMALYRNDAGSLVRTSTPLPVYQEDNAFSTMDLHSVSWADVDNDGDVDLLVPSVTDQWTWMPTVVLRNDGPAVGDAWIFTDTGMALPVAPNAVSVWGDMEGDGDLDLMLGHMSPYGDNFLDTYRNEGGILALADSGLAHVRYGMADWGDVDADGDLDVVYAGNIDLPDETGETVVRILLASPTGYTPVDVIRADFPMAGDPWLDFNAVSWADYDSDGDIDLLVSGEWLGDSEIFGRSLVYANNGGTFTRASDPLPAPIAGNAGGAFTWFDVDSDGDLDYFVAGGYYVPNGNGLIEAHTQLFRNDATVANAVPTAPTSLQSNPGPGGSVTLGWNPATDDRTPQVSLTYQLEVSAPGRAIVAVRTLPELGNVSRNTSWKLHGLPSGSYTWSVRAVDSAFNGSPLAQEHFTVGTVATPDPIDTPRPFGLSAAYPNPMHAVGRFALQLDREQQVTVGIYDVQGRRVALVHDGKLGRGSHPFSLDGTKLPSGTYFIRATGETQKAVRRVTLLR